MDSVDVVEDVVWVEQVRAGDRARFDHLVEKYQRSIYNLCYRMLGDHVLAEDAAQETFIRAYRKLDLYDAERKFSTWLFSIASNYCLDQLKRRRWIVLSWDDVMPFAEVPIPNRMQPEPSFLAAETTSEMQHLLQRLPDDYRIPIILKYWHNMSYEDIATTLDMTVSAVKSKLFRARKKLSTLVLAQRQAANISSLQPMGVAS